MAVERLALVQFDLQVCVVAEWRWIDLYGVAEPSKEGDA